MKVWVAADVNTSYLYNFQVYIGKFPGNEPDKSLGHSTVCDLMEPLFLPGRGVTTDNSFTTMQTAEFLLPKNITITGTLRVKVFAILFLCVIREFVNFLCWTFLSVTLNHAPII